MTKNAVSKVHTCLEFTYLANGAIIVTQDSAIARAASLIVCSHLPPVAVPTLEDFFQTPVVLDECVPVDATSCILHLRISWFSSSREA